MSTVINRLKLFKATPNNGLAVFCGLVSGGEEDDPGRKKVKKIIVAIEPIYPIKHDLYHCDSRFHVDQLLEQLDEHTRGEAYGFIIVDGAGALFASLQGNTPTILHSFTEELPKKHSKGGQSSVRFARNRDIAIQRYLTEVGEKSTKYFIDMKTNLPTVKNIFIAGAANLKDVLFNGNYLDDRVKRIVLQTVTISYGGQVGLRQAIEEVESTLRDVKFVHEQKVVGGFLDLVANADDTTLFGVNHVMAALDMGVVKSLVINEDLSYHRVKLIDKDGEESVVNVTKPELDKKLQSGCNLVDSTPLLEWIVEQYDKKVFSNIVLNIVSDKTSEGSQLKMGFGGIGAVLRFKVEFEGTFVDVNYEEEDLSDFI